MTNQTEDRSSGTPFFQVTTLKLVIMNTVTWGFYCLFWAYQNWKRLPAERGRKLGVVTRAIILPFIFNFPLFRRIRASTIQHGSQPLPAPVLLAFAFAALALISLWRSSWWSLVSFASVIPLAVVQTYVNRLHAHLGFDPRENGRFSALNLAGGVVGGGYLAFHVAPLVTWLYQVAVWKLQQ